jgi:hypothetical protein
MKGKTWLWIALGALALISVCCVGVLLGGAIANRNATATSQAAGAATLALATQPTLAPTQLPPTQAPTVSQATPTQPPPPPPTAPAVSQATSTQLPPPPPTATAVPTPPPPPAPPSALPPSSDLQALVDYANAMKPLLDQATVLVQRDGEILKASEGGNDAALCDGRLAADNAAMSGIVRQVRSIQPPGDASAIHDLVLRSGDAWTEAMDNVGQFCSTGNPLFKIPAVLKFWEAAANFQDAANRFWLLLLAKGVEDWVQH